MAGLQRSVQTFRRSGSSGLIWDERVLTEGGAEEEKPGGGGAEQRRPELRYSRSVGSIGMLRHSRDEAGDDDKKRKVIKPKQRDRKKQGEKKDEEEVVPVKKGAFRTRDVAPAADPPSPRVSGCVLCAIFRGSGGGGGGAAAAARRARPRKR